MDSLLIVPSGFTPDSEVLQRAEKFVTTFKPYEITHGAKLLLYFDEKSFAYYINCHLEGKVLSTNCDTDATLDSDDDDDEYYRLNREVTEDKSAYDIMEKDALKGRSFEDLVFEYDDSYRPEKPLKVYGGQHRLRAISVALRQRISVIHGVRVYFNLSRDQKVEIAIVNNTSIAVPNDLLDRMQEQLSGPQLRDWFQSIGLLGKAEDFADRKDPIIPTVRIARTLLVNYYMGLEATEDEFYQPVVCKSGGMDEQYSKIKDTIDWTNTALMTMGKEFTRLHILQRKTVMERDYDTNAEFARKSLSLAVVASWGYAAGLFQRNSEYLQNHYSLPDSVLPPKDPLNAKDLSLARFKPTDPDTYRGLGARSSAGELGRMLEVFLVQATKASKRGINKQLANAAIQSYEAKKATHQANKALRKI